jgi:hypothetical protein
VCPEELLQQVSRELARPLPLLDDYLDFLRQWNGVGATVRILTFPLKDQFDEDDIGRLQVLYGIENPTARFDIRAGRNGYSFEDRVPDSYLCIGSDDHWDRIAISLEENTYGHIMFWQPGEPWELDDAVKALHVPDVLQRRNGAECLLSVTATEKKSPETNALSCFRAYV